MLTNWYVRRSRDRFWAGDADAFDTLHTVLEVVCRVAAPLLPLTTEAIWRGLTGERSVHLTDWPSADDLPADAALVAAMDRVREVCSAALSLRKANEAAGAAAAGQARGGRRRRRGRCEPFVGLIADEVNVKEVRADHGRRRVRASSWWSTPGRAGPRLGRDVQQVIRAVKAGEWTTGPTAR